MITLFDGAQPSDYAPCYAAAPGTVIRIKGDYETIADYLLSHIPGGSQWAAIDILPGTELFTTYGAQCFVVTHAA